MSLSFRRATYFAILRDNRTAQLREFDCLVRLALRSIGAIPGSLLRLNRSSNFRVSQVASEAHAIAWETNPLHAYLPLPTSGPSRSFRPSALRAGLRTDHRINSLEKAGQLGSARQVVREEIAPSRRLRAGLGREAGRAAAAAKSEARPTPCRPGRPSSLVPMQTTERGARAGARLPARAITPAVATRSPQAGRGARIALRAAAIRAIALELSAKTRAG